MAEFSLELGARVARLLKDEVMRSQPVRRGYTPAARFRVELGSGRSAFVKLATTAGTARALRLEAQVYAGLREPFLPAVLAWEDHAELPLLILEDLSAAFWPPPWTPRLVEEVRSTLAAVHACRGSFPRSLELHGALGEDWQTVARDPHAFLSLGLASAAWLERALPGLLEASREVHDEGEELLHLDVRSDNLCRAARGVVLIDWNNACIGNGAVDTGFWLPSLHAEGGPPPESILPGRPDIAACVSGYFAARAGLPALPNAPRVRAVQLQQLRPALKWAARELGLPAPC